MASSSRKEGSSRCVHLVVLRLGTGLKISHKRAGGFVTVDIQSFSVYKSTSPPNNRFTMKTLSSIVCFVIAAAVAKPHYGFVYPQFQKQLYPVPLRPLPVVQIVPQYRPVIQQCQTVRVIKYVAGYEKQCHNANT